MSIFGWSLPAGCTTLPGEEEEEPIAFKCPTCGRFIKRDVVRTEPVEESIILDSGEKEILWADDLCYYWCDHCQAETSRPKTIYA